jgi:hypothetical protein
MLTPQQRQDFDRFGIVRMPGAVSRAHAEEMRDAIWDVLARRLRVSRDDHDTWKGQRVMGTNPIPEAMTFAQLGSPAIRAAIDDLLGQGQWQEPERWGSLLVTFPESRERWDVPYQSWHLDYPASRIGAMSELFAIRMFTCLAPLPPGAGATLAVAGSPRLVERLLGKDGDGQYRSADVRKALIRMHPWLKALCSRDDKADRVHRFMNTGAIVDGVEVRVVEFTGETGDVILTHPWILHAPAKNCAATPRFVLSSTIYRSGVVPAALYETPGQ